LDKFSRRYVHKILSISEKNVLVVTSVYLITATLSPSHKVFFVISFLYFLSLVYWTSSVKKAILYAFFPFWLFGVGRAFVFPVIPPKVVESSLYWGEGRSLIFEFSPFFILAVTSLAVMFIHILENKFKLSIPVFALFFLITYALHIISATNSPYLSNLSLIYTISEFSFLIWMLLALVIVQSASKNQRNKILTTLFMVFFGMLILESSITFLQITKRSLLGLSVEKVPSIPSFGAGAEESPFQFRPVGLSYHANSLANWVVALLFAMLTLWFQIKNTIPRHISSFLVTTTLSLSFVVILLTLSRSAYLSLLIFIGIFLIFNRPMLIKTVKFAAKYFQNLKVPILLVLIYFSFILPDRILSTLFSFTEIGGITTRLDQLTEAVELVHSSPLFGVGIGMFIPASFDFNPQGVMRYFPENIHQGYVLFLAERGILAAITYLIALYLLIKSITRLSFSKTFRLLVVAGIIANYVMMLFQPFINTLSVNILIAGVLIGAKSNEKKVSGRS